MLKSLVRSFFYLRSIARSLDKIATLYALELEYQGIRQPDPQAADSDVEIMYGAKAPESELR